MLASQILAAGGCVLIEKPLAPSLAEAQKLNALVAEDSANLMLGHVALFGSEFRGLQANLAGRSPTRFIDAVRHRPVATLQAYPGESPFHLTMVHDLVCVQALMQGREPSEWQACESRVLGFATSWGVGD